jgi:hypothetical protein
MPKIFHTQEEANPKAICWLEARFESIPDLIREYPKRFGKTRASFHTTLLYGYDLKFSQEIIKSVMNSIPLEVMTGVIKKAKTGVVFLQVISEDLKNIFLELYKVYPNKYSHIQDTKKTEEKFYPHITLMRFSKKAFSKFRILDPYALSGQKLIINQFLSCQHNKPGSTLILDSVEFKNPI